jgi:ferredoxin
VAYKIIDTCINCGACESECPNQAISQGDPIFVIDPNRCTECVGYFDSPQCVAVCPNESVLLDPDHKETKEELLAKKTRLGG